MLEMFILRYEDMKDVTDSALRLDWDRNYAERAAKSAGLVEQAKNAVTELDCINAVANIVANLYSGDNGIYSRSYAVMEDWFVATQDNGFFDYASIRKICNKITALTVGEYLELVENLSLNFRQEILDEKKSA